MEKIGKDMKINELKEKDRLDMARFSISYKAPEDINKAMRRAYEIIAKLGSGRDAIMEFNSSYILKKEKPAAITNKNKNPFKDYTDELKHLGITYTVRKIPNAGAGSFLAKLFSFGGGKSECDEVLAYIDGDMLLSNDILHSIPSDGVRFYFIDKGVLMGDSGNHYDAINRFTAMTDDEKLAAIEMAVFSYMHFGQMGISTLKMELADLKEILLAGLKDII